MKAICPECTFEIPYGEEFDSIELFRCPNCNSLFKDGKRVEPGEEPVGIAQ